MTTSTAESTRLWRGNSALEALLVDVDALRTHPRNPRRGNTEEIRRSLERFGQQRPILALTDGTIVAGNHTFRALVEMGWSHVAVVRSDLGQAEVEAYLLADNRLSDLGAYDDLALGELLAPFYESDDLAGLGYTRDDVTALLAEIDGWAGPLDEIPPRLDQLGTSVDGGRSYTLLYSEEEADEFERLAGEREAQLGTRNLPSTILAVLRRE